jgi:hypothetical protein
MSQKSHCKYSWFTSTVSVVFYNNPIQPNSFVIRDFYLQTTNKKMMKQIFTILLLAILFASVANAQERRLLSGDNTTTYSTQTDREGYCVPSANCSEGDGLTSFEFAGIENKGSGCSQGGYGDFTTLTGQVTIGQNYTVVLTSGYSSQFVTIWIDVNDNETFESTEIYLKDFLITESSKAFEAPIAIDNGQAGSHRMRVGVNYGKPSSPDACADFTYGEYEDYTIEMIGASIDLNAKLLSFDMYHVQAKGEIKPLVTVTNRGYETVSFPVVCKDMDGTYTSTKQVENLAFGEKKQIEFDVWDIASGTYDLSIETQLVNDELPGDDQVSPTLTVIDYAPEKNVVAEEATGTWCGWCVRGHVYMDSMHHKYPDTFIGIAVHAGDPMQDATYKDGIGQFVSGYPGGLVNRVDAADPGEFEEFYKKHINRTATASIEVKDVVVDKSTNTITFNVSSEFLVDTDNHRFNAVIIEDSVTGTGDGWSQNNSYSGFSTPMGGYENLPNPVSAEDMVYMDVARAILGGWKGQSGSLPEAIEANTTHSYEFTADFNADWDVNNIRVAGMLINQNTGAIINAAQTAEITITGINEKLNSQAIKVYPNPANDKVNVELTETNGTIELINSNGTVVKSIQASSFVNVINISDLTQGIYMVRVVAPSAQYCKTMVVQ